MTTVRQAAHALEILEYFARRLKPATPAEMADDLGWPRSSTFKLIGTLAGMGYLYEPRPRGGYYPSPRWLTLAQAVTNAEPLAEKFQRLARDLMEATGETAAISAPAGIFATFVDVAESRQPVRYFARVGDRVPIHATSAGRALLSLMPRAEREKLYRKIDFIAYAPTTPASPEAVEARIAEADAMGWHQSNTEYTPDLAGIAMPLPGEDRLLSVVVVGPVSRCLERRADMAAVVREHLKRLK